MIKNKQSGLTLVELVVATTIIAGLTILIMNFLVTKYVENARDNAKADLLLQTQLTLDLLSRDIKHSANVDGQNRWEDSNSPGSPGDNFSWSSDGDTLILAQPVQDASDNIIYQDPQTYVSYKDDLIYFVGNDGRLYRRTLAAPVQNNAVATTCPPPGDANCASDSQLAENIMSFTLTYFDANDNQVAPSEARSVQIAMSVRERVFGRDQEVSRSIRTVFRNE